MNEDYKIMLDNKLHEVKYFIRDVFTLEKLLEIKEVIEDSIEDKKDE